VLSGGELAAFRNQKAHIDGMLAQNAGDGAKLTLARNEGIEHLGLRR